MPIQRQKSAEKKKACAVQHRLLKRGYISFKAFDMCLVWTNTVIYYILHNLSCQVVYIK